MNKGVSLNLVTFNCQGTIIDCLESLELDNPLFKEIVIVDNGSTDSTVQLVKSFLKDFPIKSNIILNTENNVGLARQKAVSASEGDIIAFIDPDCIAPSLWVSNLYNQLLVANKRFDNIFGISAPNRLPWDNPLFEVSNRALNYLWVHGRSPQAWIPPDFSSVSHLPTTNCMIFRKNLLLIGNFSEEFSRVGEDLELGCRARSFGLMCYHSPSPIVENNSAENLKDWAYRMFCFGQVQPLLSWKLLKVGKLHCSGFLSILLICALISGLFGFPVQLLFKAYLGLSLIFFLLFLGQTSSLKKAFNCLVFITVTHLSYLAGQIYSLFGQNKVNPSSQNNVSAHPVD